jgi:hypothetical protein
MNTHKACKEVTFGSRVSAEYEPMNIAHTRDGSQKGAQRGNGTQMHRDTAPSACPNPGSPSQEGKL